MRKIVDLSVTLENGMMYYPGDPVPEISPALTLEKDGCRVTNLAIGSHTGTHMDAPSHFVKEGKTIEQIALSKCMGKAAVIKLTNLEPCHKITAEDIKEQLPKNGKVQIILFHTDWTEKYGTKVFYQHPYLSKEAAELLVSLGISVVGVDMLNVDHTCLEEEMYTEESTEAHQVLLGNDVLIVENLTNLGAIDFVEPYVVFTPLKIKGADGSPVRALAFPAKLGEISNMEE